MRAKGKEGVIIPGAELDSRVLRVSIPEFFPRPCMCAARASATRAAAIAIAIAFAHACAAQDLSYPPEHHPWGRFPAASWKRVRVVSETLDLKGSVANVTVTEVKTTLIAADQSSYTLQSESVIEVAGKRLATQPETVKHGYYGEAAGQTVTVKKLGEGQMTISGRAIPYELRQAVFSGADGSKRISTIFYSGQTTPYHLRRETAIEGADEQRSGSTVEVVALALPQKVMNELRNADFLKTTQKLPQGTKTTLEVLCEDVPGGVVAHSASEFDLAGNVVRRSALELIDYHIGTEEDPPLNPRRRLFPRIRARQKVEKRGGP